MHLRRACVAVLMVSLAACGDNSGPGNVGRTADAPTRAERQIDEALQGFTQGAPREGLAAAIAIDVSGSMDDRVTGEDGRRARKIDVARRAARDLIEQFAAYAEAHKDEPVLLGVYEFSRRSGEPDARAILPMAPPDRTLADAALSRLDPDGGTPIGQAMLAAKRELDATGLSRRTPTASNRRRSPPALPGAQMRNGRRSISWPSTSKRAVSTPSATPEASFSPRRTAGS
jgi:Mg-chelatase subunit ChlD